MAQTKDKQTIKKLQQGFAEAWNREDIKAMASFWAADGDLINPFGQKAKGRAAVQKLFAAEHATFAKGSQFMVDVSSVRLLKPDVAIVDCAWRATGMYAADGREQPPLQGLYTAVLVRKQGKWAVAASRPMIPVPPPG